MENIKDPSDFIKKLIEEKQTEFFQLKTMIKHENRYMFKNNPYIDRSKLDGLIYQKKSWGKQKKMLGETNKNYFSDGRSGLP